MCVWVLTPVYDNITAYDAIQCVLQDGCSLGCRVIHLPVKMSGDQTLDPPDQVPKYGDSVCECFLKKHLINVQINKN